MFLKIATGLTVVGLLLGGFLSILQEILIWSRAINASSFFILRIIGIVTPLVLFVPLILFVIAVFMRLNTRES